MRFKSATIKEFRRFTDLTVQGIPNTVRLIMLAGPNGCGKSSFFDALHTWHKWTSRKAQSWEMDYHGKAGSPPRDRWNNDVTLDFYDSLPAERRKVLYFRSAYRNDPEFQVNRLQQMGDPLDEVRVSRMIDNDAAVSRNYRALACKVFEIFDEPPMMTDSFVESIIGPIRDPIRRLFPDLELNSLANPLKDGTFRFTKGASQGFAYKNLSGGEKAAFDLILDLVVARTEYNNTVFCIDEPESHMNARLQAELLSVLYDLVPENCQLMLATHSIGMMRRARDIEAKIPGSVAFLDFEGRDFDMCQVIAPTKPDRTFWENAYKVALDDLAALVSPSRVVICEGHPRTQNAVANHSHDARCYERIFETEFPETRFVSMGNDHEIVGDKRGLAEALGLLIKGVEVVRLIDRDDRSEEEISDETANGVQVLSRRNLESYLFDDEVLTALAKLVNHEDKIEELLAEKLRILTTRKDNPPDDLKRASGQIFNACKSILSLPTGYGNNARTFMRDTLAPLVTASMIVYQDLKHDIFNISEDSDRHEFNSSQTRSDECSSAPIT